MKSNSTRLIPKKPTERELYSRKHYCYVNWATLFNKQQTDELYITSKRYLSDGARPAPRPGSRTVGPDLARDYYN